MEETIFETEEVLSKAEIAKKLQKIAEGVEKGEITLGSGNNSVTLKPSDNSEFEVKVEEEQNGEKSLEMEIEWNDEKEDEGGLEIN